MPTFESAPRKKSEEEKRDALIAQHREQIEKEGEALPVILDDLYNRGKRFVLVGENHTQIDAVHKAVQESLLQLRMRGMTHLFLENGRDMQSVIDNLDVSQTDEECIAHLKQKGVFGTLYSEENLRTMILAKRIGLKVVFIDDPLSDRQASVEERIPHRQRDTMGHERRKQLKRQELLEQDARDGRMFETLVASIDDQSKGLVIIGTIHVRKSKWNPSEDKQVWVRTVGSCLAEQFGEQVSSMRYVHTGAQIDGTYNPNTLAPKDIYPELSKVIPLEHVRIVVMKDAGLFEGDKRTTDSDFVLLPTMQ